MKNPFAFFKHLAKDPVNNVEEAEARKKEILPWLLGSVGGGVLCGILEGILGTGFLSIVILIAVAGMMFFGFLYAVASDAKARFAALTCQNCGTIAEFKSYEEFMKHVSFTVIEDKATFVENQHSKVSPTNGVHSFVQVNATASAVLAVDITCPKCGEVKHLRYNATPFQCYAEKKNVSTLEYERVYHQMATAVRNAVLDYNDPEKRKLIPYTYQSTKSPYYEEEYKARILGPSEVNIDYMGAKIKFHKDVEEMLLHYFVKRELSGKLYDPNHTEKSFLQKILGLFNKK